MKKIECCHNCTERFVYKEGDKIIDCHSTCQKYKDESEALKEHNATIYKKKLAEKDVRNYFYDIKPKRLKSFRRTKKDG